jgi:hypothetical protein
VCFSKLLRFISLAVFFQLLTHLLVAQSVVPFNKIKDDYTDGEDFFNSEDYKEALFLFLKITGNGYSNANLKYKIGVCYLNLPGQEQKAIPYLEEATKSVSTKYKRDNLEEKSAPLETWFYLGKAYRLDNQLDKAMKTYERFTRNPMVENYNAEIIDNEISACEIAKSIQEKPVDVTIINMGNPINTPQDETFVAISGNDSTIVYLEALKLYNAVMLVHKTAQGWSEPENLNAQIMSDGEFYPTDLSYNGKELYLVRKTEKNTDIYVSNCLNGKWSIAQKLNKNVNTIRDENYACISADNKTLYFSSNRKESKGGFDIFRSVRDASGEWGAAENLGKAINTKEDEVCPSVSNDGQVLYFSSKSHYNMGGFDVFVSRMEDKKWDEPKNVGYPVNTTNDNYGFQITANAKVAIMPRPNFANGTGLDIFQLNFQKVPGR